MSRRTRSSLPILGMTVIAALFVGSGVVTSAVTRTGGEGSNLARSQASSGAVIANPVPQLAGSTPAHLPNAPGATSTTSAPTARSAAPAGGPGTTATSAPEPVSHGRFHVVGRNIIDPSGDRFVPRGVNKSGLEWKAEGYEIVRWNFERMQGWGANVVRLPISPHFWMSSMCTYDPNYALRIDKVVEWTESLGMLLILDNHWSTQGRTCGKAGWAGQQKMADTHSLEFVTALAARYKDRPWVAFDLYNEPHDISDAVWRNGGSVDGWQAVGMQQLLDGVRSTGATNLVFVSGNMWANDLRMVVDDPLERDADVVYAAHSYPLWCNGPVPDNQPYACYGRRTPPYLETMIAPAIAKRAVMVTEFGTRRAIPEEISDAIDWFEAHGVGWAAWAWAAGPASEYCLLSESGDLSPSALGEPVQQSLWAARGWTSLFGR